MSGKNSTISTKYESFRTKSNQVQMDIEHANLTIGKTFHVSLFLLLHHYWIFETMLKHVEPINQI